MGDGVTNAGQIKQRLAAIMAADVAGYSRLMAADEAATIAMLDAARAVFRSQIADHGGRVVDMAGDSVLAVFDSVVSATRAATAVQQVLGQNGNARPEDRRMRFRIGVNLGEIHEKDDGTIYGDGVNVAARLEALADPGGVMLSDDAFRQVDGKVELAFADAGSHAVKNIAKPVRAYRVVLDGATAPKPKRKITALTAALALLIVAVAGGGAWFWQRNTEEPAVTTSNGAAPAGPTRQEHEASVAVLPFQNLTTDPAYAFLADGLHENIISTLSQARRLFVPARFSTLQFREPDADVGLIAQTLGVAHILEGSVQVAGNRVRIIMQLIDGTTGGHVWTERYDRPLEDIFALQDEITLEVVNALQVQLTEGSQAARWRGGTTKIDAWAKWQQGVTLYRNFSEPDNARARDLFAEAVDIDPEFALGWTYLGFAEESAYRFGWSDDSGRLARAREYADKALALQDSLAVAYNLRAIVHLTSDEHQAAVEASRRAIEVDPGGSLAHAIRAVTLMAVGDYQAALAASDEAFRLSPVHPHWYLLDRGHVLLLSGRIDEAMALLEQYTSRVPTDDDGAHLLAIATAKSGRRDEAKAAVVRLTKRLPGYSIDLVRRHGERAWAYQDPAVLESHLDALRSLGVPEHPPGAAATRPSIAVLPFDNLSGDPEQDYFAAGLTDEIITELGRFNGVAVVPYAGANSGARAIGQETNTAFVVNGSVRKAADTIKVAVRLLESQSGAQRWAETYENDLKAADLLDLQYDIAQQIVATLADTYGVLSQIGLETVRKKGADSLQAYECILRDNEYRRANTPETHLIARTCLEHVVTAESNFAEAWARLSHAYVVEFAQGFNARPNPSEALQQGYEAAQQAIALDRTGEVGYLALARALFFQREPERFLAAAETAVDLNPNNADVIGTIGQYVANAGHWDRGLALMRTAMTLSPFHPRWYHIPFIINHYRKGEYQQVVNYAARANIESSWALAASLARLGRMEEAEQMVAKLVRDRPDLARTAGPELKKWYYSEALANDLLQGLRLAGLAVAEPSN